MKTLRASASRIQADVVIGRNQYGGDVTVHVTLDRKDDEVIAVLSQLDALLRRRAFAHINEAVEEATVQRRVAEKVNSERERITKNAKASAEAAASVRITELERELRLAQHANTRLQQQAAEHAATHLDDGSNEKEG